MLNYLRSSVYALTVPLIFLSIFSKLLCKITKTPTPLPVDFKDLQDCQLTDMCRMLLFQWMTRLCRLYIGKRKMEKILELIVENKHIHELEIN